MWPLKRKQQEPAPRPPFDPSVRMWSKQLKRYMSVPRSRVQIMCRAGWGIVHPLYGGPSFSGKVRDFREYLADWRG